jgi:metal-dependent HD superfamily phosphatase/phosphodiesterase
VSADDADRTGGAPDAPDGSDRGDGAPDPLEGSGQGDRGDGGDGSDVGDVGDVGAGPDPLDAEDGPDTGATGDAGGTGDVGEQAASPETPPSQERVERAFPRTLDERLEERVVMNVPDRDNPRLASIIERVNADDDLYALWTAANVTAINRLGMTDHGPVHVKIVMNIAVRLFRLLADAGVEFGIVRDHGFGREDAEVVVALAALLHDLGMSIHRADHEAFSLFVAQSKLRELLEDEYPTAAAAIVRSEVLHAIIAHRSGGKPLTLEAGIVRIADALDMAKGRSRIPFERESSVSIHSVSAAAIDQVHIERGADKPIRLVIEMSNSAGVFQLDQLFRDKLKGSGLEPYIELEAEIEGEKEKRLLHGFRL